MTNPLSVLSCKAKSLAVRLTLSRVTIAFLSITLVVCFVQGLIQVLVYRHDSDAHTFVADIVQVGQVPTGNLPLLTRKGSVYTLQLCDNVPGTTKNGSSPCVTIFENGNSEFSNKTIPSGFRRSDTDSSEIASDKPFATQGVTLLPVLNTTGGTIGVNMSYNDDSPSVFLNNQCTRVLLYPAQVLRFSTTESLALLAVQLWLLGISFYALVSQSVPHVMAVLPMRALSVGWSAYTIWRTMDIRQRFEHLVINEDSACQFDLFHDYFFSRLMLQIPDLIIGTISLLVVGYLSRPLVRMFGMQVFRCVGPPPKILRAYRYFLATLVCLHVNLYMTAAALGLWGQQLMQSAIAKISGHTTLYVAVFAVGVALFLPWMVVPVYGIRHEDKRSMFVFLLLSMLLVAGWASMFHSHVYTWTWLQWPFFASCTLAAFILTITSGVFAVVCWSDFGVGLAHYLDVEKRLAKAGFEPDSFNQAEMIDDKKAGTRASLVSNRGRPLSVMKRDINWDFSRAEDHRPPIYSVELSPNPSV